METKKKAVAKSSPKAAAKAKKIDIPAAAVAKMADWNEKHPEGKFSWVVIAPDTPAGQKICRTCKKEFREGRITRVDSKGAYCGPKCHRASFAK